MNERTEEVKVTATETHISWKSIFAGVVLALIIQTTLALLGLGIGLSTINPATEQNPAGAGLGIGSMIWWVIVSIVALYFGGWTSSRMAGILSRAGGVIHGLVTWGLSSILMLFLITSTVGAIIGGSLGLLRNTAMVSGQVLQSAPGLQQNLQQNLQQGQQQLQQQQQQMTPADRERMEQRARQVGQQAASGAAAASLGTFFMMLLGGIAAAIGGAMGRTRGLMRV